MRWSVKYRNKIINNNNKNTDTWHQDPVVDLKALVSDPQQSPEDIFPAYLKLSIINISVIDIGN